MATRNAALKALARYRSGAAARGEAFVEEPDVGRTD